MDQREIMLKGGYLTAREAAERVGVNAATIYRLISKGKVKSGKAGQQLFVEARSLAALYQEAPPIYERILEGVDDEPEGGGNGAKRR